MSGSGRQRNDETTRAALQQMKSRSVHGMSSGADNDIGAQGIDSAEPSHPYPRPHKHASHAIITSNDEHENDPEADADADGVSGDSAGALMGAAPV